MWFSSAICLDYRGVCPQYWPIGHEVGCRLFHISLIVRYFVTSSQTVGFAELRKTIDLIVCVF